MSKASTISRGSSRISRQSSRTWKESSIQDGNLEARFPQIRCMDDVIDNFFNQIVQYVIEDMVVVETKEEESSQKYQPDEEIKDYKDLKSEDLLNAEVTSASGSRVTLTKRSSIERRMKKKSLSAKLEMIKEESSQQSISKSSNTSSDLSMNEERQVKITFINGNVYEGAIFKRIMNGKGRYTWVDGTVYEGDFKDGFPTGKGTMTLPDLSHYEGDFNRGLFHGNGFLNIVSTPTFYSGEWKNGMKHGQGWLLYEPGDWYEGGWAKDLKHGFGVRCYKNGAKYRGMWSSGKYDGQGIMIWENNDYYKGEWSEGAMHGEGEYVWKAFYNNAFAFPARNIYRGLWENGKRNGSGCMIFGDDTGIKLLGTWSQDFKHGDGYLVCGNGRIIDRSLLFRYDKPIEPEMSAWSLKSARNTRWNKILEFPVFNAPEYVDVGFYVDYVIVKLENVSNEKLKMLKSFEEKCIQHVIIKYLPQLKELYQEYATLAAKTELSYEPTMIRLFLWQLYKDKKIYKRGISLAATDLILVDNPKSCLDTAYNPFEPIYFWQFLMSLIAVALTTTSLDEIYDTSCEGISASIVRKFFDEFIFKKTLNRSPFLLNYMDLAPIKAVYSLYQKIGEPHSARTFLRECCTKKGEAPLLCYEEVVTHKLTPKLGTNLVLLDQDVGFEGVNDLNVRVKRGWNNLYDFRHLGPRNIVRCLAKSCPLIKDEDLVVNIDYPLTFLEFYETLLTCMFMVLELEMKKEEKTLRETLPPPPHKESQSQKTVITEPKKKEVKKSGKKKTKKHA